MQAHYAETLQICASSMYREEMIYTKELIKILLH